MKSYDLIVIGGGPAGYEGAVQAAKLDKSVALIESRELGGTCLNRGCIPTKTLLHTAALVREIRENGELLGIEGSAAVNYEKLCARRDEVVGKLRLGIEQLMKVNKVDVYREKAAISDKNTVKLSDGTVLHAQNILIATGSEPAVPPIEGAGLEGVITSDGLLENEMGEIAGIIIIGGGVIGVECADIFTCLGCEVTLIEGLERILPLAETEVSRSLTAVLKKRGADVFAGALVEKIEKAPEGLKVSFTQKGRTIERSAECVLIATGRRAYTKGLFTDGFTLETNKGAIVTDSHFCTSVQGVYAVGDAVFGSRQLAHSASAEAVNAVCAMFAQEEPIRLEYVPSCIYTSPEIAFVGLTEEQAKKQGIAVKTGKALTGANGKSVIVNADRGFIRTVFDAQSGKLLGATLMCERATDIICEISAALCASLTDKQLSSVMYPHPTFCEAVGESVKALR